MHIEKQNKAFAYRVSIGDYNYLQCSQSKNIDTPDGMKNYDYEGILFMK